MSRWFRHYAGMMRDDKLVRAAIRSKQTIERVVWIWGAILESAAEVDDAGRYDLDAEEIAYFLRADRADVDAVLVALESLGRIDSGAVVKWSDRQFQSDRSADRQRRYRERKAAADAEREQDDGQAERDNNDEVTSLSRHGDAPETETELEEITVSNETVGEIESEILLPEHVVSEWNTVATRLAKPRVRDITPERRQLIRARIAQYSIEDFVDVFGKVERSPFLRGDTGAWRGCTFDWVMKKGNFQKVLEGNYDQ